MNEKLLHFIWQFQYYNQEQLTTVNGNHLQVLHCGQLNQDQGPDFLAAKIKIDDITLAGNVELHVNASHWYQHHHEKDHNYNHIILHVVWINDKPVLDTYQKQIPTLELQTLVPKVLLQQYNKLMQEKKFIPCENHLPVLSNIGWMAWKERLLTERLEHKSIHIIQNLLKANHHWEEVFWWHLARNFGMHVNNDFLEQVAKSLPVSLLAKHKNQIHQLEALLLGQAGLLNGDYSDKYPRLLQKEYAFLARKYSLVTLPKSPLFLRMRPANFPTIRLAQLAMLVQNSTHLFSKIIAAESIKDLKVLFNVTANDYWHYHYLFDEATPYQPKKTGHQFINNILINTVIPVVFSYGQYREEQYWKDKAIHWLLQSEKEDNSLTKKWKALGIENKAAFDSQALLELKNNYCNNKRCLECAVGNKLLSI